MRLILTKLHLYLGLLGGVLLTVIAATGALYAFEPQLRAWWGEPMTEATAETLLSPMEIERSLRAKGFEGEPRLFLWSEEKTLPMWVRWEDASGKLQNLLLDPVTGRRLPRAEQAQAFFHQILEIHRTLAGGETGKLVVGFSSAALLLLTISGLCISVRRWRDARRVWMPNRAERRSRSRRVRWRFWHRIIGAWVTPWLLLMPLTGMVWSFDVYADFLRWLGGPSRFATTPQVIGSESNSRIPLESIWERCQESRIGEGAMRLVLPSDQAQPIRFEWAPPQVASSAMRSRIYFDPSSGAVLDQHLWEEFSVGEQVTRWAYPLHTGRVWGVFGQTLAFFAALSVPFFFASGLYLYVARRRKSTSPVFNHANPCKHPQPETDKLPSPTC